MLISNGNYSLQSSNGREVKTGGSDREVKLLSNICLYRDILQAAGDRHIKTLE